MEFVLSVVKRRCVCFVVSDFFDDRYLDALRTANRKHDVIAVLISDPREVEVPSLGLVTLEDAETGRQRLVDTGSAAFRRRVQELGEARKAALQETFMGSGIDFIQIETTGSVVEPLIQFFQMRERRRR